MNNETARLLAINLQTGHSALSDHSLHIVEALWITVGFFTLIASDNKKLLCGLRTQHKLVFFTDFYLSILQVYIMEKKLSANLYKIMLKNGKHLPNRLSTNLDCLGTILISPPGYKVMSIRACEDKIMTGFARLVTLNLLKLF